MKLEIHNMPSPITPLTAGHGGAAEMTDPARADGAGKEAQPAGQETAVALLGQEAVDALLKELTEKLSFSQKIIDNMPESLKNEIRNLLAQKATLLDLGKGLTNLVQGQKDIFNNLNKLSGDLSRLAQFLAEAEPESADAAERRPDVGNDHIPFTRDAVLAKLDIQRFQKLLADIAGGKETVQAGEDEPGAAPVKSGGTSGEPKGGALEQLTGSRQTPTLINKQAIEGSSAQKQTVAGTGSAPPAAAQERNDKAETAPSGRLGNFSGGQAIKGQPAGQKNDLSSFFRDMTAVSGLADAEGQKALNNLASAIKAVAGKTAAQPSEKQDAAESRGAADAANQPLRGNISVAGKLLLPAREALAVRGTLAESPELPAQNQPVKAQDIATLFKNLAALKQSLDAMSGEDPRLARALQALNGDPAVFSPEEKALLPDVLARLVKGHFQDKAGLDVLERALNHLATKDRLPLDKETAGLQVFARLLKNADSLQYPRRQVQEWADSLRELADNMIKTVSVPGEKSSQHIQSSFVFNLATEGQEKHTPVYINIYREKGGRGEAAGKSGETWLRVNVSPEYVGQVTAIFHLYQESLLDVKVVFANQDGMEEFSRFLPDIEDALRGANMQINSITVA